jgi:isopenicillin N synthase-like dioxygenase
LRANEHTDYGTQTLLWRFDDCPGLQLFDDNKDGWIDVPIVENSIVLNIADMFARWTNDVFKSTPHRVVNVAMDRPRYSMPYFVDPGRDVMIENLMGTPAKYPPISAYEYLKWRLSQSYVDSDYIEDEEVKKDGKQYLPEQQKYSKG